MFPDYANFRLFGIGVLKPISEPVRHGIPEHEYVALWYGTSLIRRWKNPRGIYLGARCLGACCLVTIGNQER